MRIRSIKPEYWESSTICSLTWDARLILKALECYVDDNGAGRWDPQRITYELFGRDLIRDPEQTIRRVEVALEELRAAGLIWVYRSEDVNRAGREVAAIYIANWEQVQRIEHANRGRIRRPDGTLEYGESLIQECPSKLRDSFGWLPAASEDFEPFRKASEDYGRLRKASENCWEGTGEQSNRGTDTMRTFGEPKDAPRAKHTDDAPKSIIEQPALIDAPEAQHSESQDHVSGDPVGDPDPNQPSRHEQADTPQPDTPPVQPTGSRYSAEFETWWDGYPVKRGKAKAAKAFKKARQRASLETLTQGRDRYAAWLAAHPDRSPKWAEGWLNGDRWEDDLTVGDPTDSSGGGGGVIDMWRKAQELHASRPGIGGDWASTRDDLEPEPPSPPPQLAATIAQITAGFGAG